MPRRSAPSPIARVTLGGACVALAAAAACSHGTVVSISPGFPVGLELVVTTDGRLAAPADFDEIRLEVVDLTDGSKSLLDRDFALPQTKLPIALGLSADMDARSGPVILVSATALVRATGQPVVQRLVEVQVPNDRMALLYLVLAKACEGQVELVGAEAEPRSTCPAGESCQPTGPSAGLCDSNMFTGDLPTYVVGVPFDAGVAIGDGAAAGSSSGGSSSGSSSGSGSGGSFDAGDSGLHLPCPPGSQDCLGPQPVVCEGTSWLAAGAPCSGVTPMCMGGSCVVCANGATRCADAGEPQTCEGTFWLDLPACAPTQTCSAGACVGCVLEAGSDAGCD